ncbi:hypothetical protein ASD15_28900 [Massilia sp. Root351]|nr:hypothetical protein ASD15_28900 [Massilia sp. Root351]
MEVCKGGQRVPLQPGQRRIADQQFVAAMQRDTSHAGRHVDARRRQLRQAHQGAHGQAVRRTGQQRADAANAFSRAAGPCAAAAGAAGEGAEGVQPGQAHGAAALAGCTEGVENHATAYGLRGLRVAQHEAVAGHGMDFLLEHQLRAGGVAGQYRVRVQRHDVGGMVGCAQVHVYRRPGLERGAASGQQRQLGIDAQGAGGQRRGDHPAAAFDLVARCTGQVESQALPRAAFAGGAVLGMDAAHAHFPASRRQCQRIAHGHAARQRGPRDHCALAGQREHAVHAQPEQAVLVARRQNARGGGEVQA